MPDSQDVISVAPVAEPDWPDAIRYLEQAVKAGNQDPHALYLLAMAYKHQNRSAEARQTLAKIAAPDANVLLAGAASSPLTTRNGPLPRRSSRRRRKRTPRRMPPPTT